MRYYSFPLLPVCWENDSKNVCPNTQRTQRVILNRKAKIFSDNNLYAISNFARSSFLKFNTRKLV